MNTSRPPRAIVLLGAQRFDPTLGDAVREEGVEGSIAVITAGWQEREIEDLDLHEHLQGRTINLRLHARADEVFAQDPDLRAGHREKQSVLRHKQDFYRVRLEHALEANHKIVQRKAPASILAEELEASLAAIRQLDEYHLAQCARVHREFDAAFHPTTRESVERHRSEIREILRNADALAIAGGNVATLINRLRLFGINDLIDGHPVFAWSGGAMVVVDSVVLFHDSPPQGLGLTEVLDHGLGLCAGVVLPQPEMRLKLDDAERVSVMARRFAPSRCFALPARSRVTFRNGRAEHVHGPIELRLDGTHALLEPSASVQVS